MERNRVKRRVREWFRRERTEIGSALDVLVIARRPAAELGPREVDPMLSNLVARAARAR